MSIQRGRKARPETPCALSAARYGLYRQPEAFFRELPLPFFASILACLERWAGEAVAPDAPEMYGHQDARHQRNKDAVENVKTQQCVRADLAAAEEKCAR